MIPASRPDRRETGLWEGPEALVDVAIRRHSPLRPGYWFRSYAHPTRAGWIQLFKVRPAK